MLNHVGSLEVIEIKRPKHALTNTEFSRAFGYLTAVRKFIDDTAEVANSFPNAKLTIVCNELNLGDLEIKHHTDMIRTYLTRHGLISFKQQTVATRTSLK